MLQDFKAWRTAIFRAATPNPVNARNTELSAFLESV
jgi:hypothetical protein